MKRKKLFKFCASVIFVLLIGFLCCKNTQIESIQGVIFNSFTKLFQEKNTVSDLKKKYSNNYSKIKILIVPGHDNSSVGAWYKNLEEADLNVELVYNILDFFNKDNKYVVYATREKNGNYSPWFLEYTENNYADIKIFRDYFKSVMAFLTETGGIKKQDKAQVEHNPAADNTSINLYAINKFANESDIDIVVHVHFNDYPGRNKNYPGKYSGFSIYIPEKQLPNHNTSANLAESIKNRLQQYFPKSNFPGESETDSIIEDQELIAVGSNASMKKASILIEYGYIYEPQFVHPEARAIIFKSMAEQTYLGIKDFFEKK